MQFQHPIRTQNEHNRSSSLRPTNQNAIEKPYLGSENYLAVLQNRPKSRTSKKVLYYQQHKWS